VKLGGYTPGVCHYVRYIDDDVLLHPSKKRNRALVREVYFMYA
jgi:hypothetical protein